MDDSPLLCEPSEKARLETENGVAQIDYVAELVNIYKANELRASHVLELQKIAVDRIYPCGGTYRDARFNVVIQGSDHRVPEPALVKALVEDAVDWINRERGRRPGLQRAAYALWRLNWIHPFAGGNGRTSRAVAYLVACMDAGAFLPGERGHMMPEQIYETRDEYVACLRAADAEETAGREPTFAAMSTYLERILTRQLASTLQKLNGPVA